MRPLISSEFGLALHTTQDATSPAHTGFQIWRGTGYISDALAHVKQEDFDPGPKSKLDKATWWLWTFFTCPINGPELPEDFFAHLGSDPGVLYQDSP
jgi:hypothetical protein